MDARSVAATLIAEVLAGRALTPQLRARHDAVLEGRDRGFAQELTYGTLRWWPKLDWLIGRLLQRKGLRRQDDDIRALLAVGLYQIIELDTPAHAAVSATVAAARQLNKPWATGLLNGVMRSFLRQREILLQDAEADMAAHWAHPDWLLDGLQHDWPEDWMHIAQANNARPPMTLRVNARQNTRSEYVARLLAEGLECEPSPVAEQALTVVQPVDVRTLPGFMAGRVSVQDAAAQLAVPLLDLQPGQRVLDACAAPGGKTCHIAESQRDLARLLALDNDAERSSHVRENLERLALDADVMTADASVPDAWWDTIAFDRILIDAPCSATGVIRRHPDIKLLRKAADVAPLCQRQQALLDALWPLLARGGKLLYVTCSLLQAENRRQIEQFVVKHGDAECLPLRHPLTARVDRDLQIMPGQAGMDGFYYALLHKTG